jgi:hypothetical protein
LAALWAWLGGLPQPQASFIGTLTGSFLGLVALLLGALFNAHLNPREELDAVSGGFFDFLNTVTQVNAVGAQIGVAFGGAVLQGIGQSNTSTI